MQRTIIIWRLTISKFKKVNICVRSELNRNAGINRLIFFEPRKTRNIGGWIFVWFVVKVSDEALFQKFGDGSDGGAEKPSPAGSSLNSVRVPVRHVATLLDQCF